MLIRVTDVSQHQGDGNAERSEVSYFAGGEKIDLLDFLILCECVS